jgi:hypothetical protein
MAHGVGGPEFKSEKLKANSGQWTIDNGQQTVD